MERGYTAVNPIMRKVIRTRTAFLWNTLEPEGYLEPKRSRLVLSEAAEFGLRDGFACPIVHTNGNTVIVTFAAERLDDDPRLVPSLHLIALYFHKRFKELQGLDQGAAVPDLTRQEENCLALASGGKTDWEISEILSISESTVRTYIERAKQKFGVTTKIQAVVEAKRHLLIHT
jgi:DNA-binding CsgD family transcriptional regulator